jgi:hypothetical protein
VSERTVSTDALETLGMIHTRLEKRDAIHLAVIPVEAGENLPVGAHLKYVNGKAFRAVRGAVGAIGIVDPFLAAEVKKGERFWLVIYPRMIASLRHVWSHPALPNEVGDVSPSTIDAVKELERRDAIAVSEAWLRAFAEEKYVDYFEMLEAARDGDTVEGPTGYEDYGGRETDEEFWAHVEVVLGSTVDAKKRDNFYVSYPCCA